MEVQYPAMVIAQTEEPQSAFVASTSTDSATRGSRRDSIVLRAGSKRHDGNGPNGPDCAQQPRLQIGRQIAQCLVLEVGQCLQAFLRCERREQEPGARDSGRQAQSAAQERVDIDVVPGLDSLQDRATAVPPYNAKESLPTAASCGHKVRCAAGRMSSRGKRFKTASFWARAERHAAWPARGPGASSATSARKTLPPEPRGARA